MANTARNHHYLPQCYLRNFRRAGGNSKKPSLYVFDIITGERFPTSVRNVGARRDFNRINSDSHPPDVLEGVYATLETEFAEVFRMMRRTRVMPEGESLNILFNFIALCATRNPGMRKRLSDYQAQIFETVLEITLANEERWESQKQKMIKAGYVVDDSVTYQQLKEFHDERRYTIEIPNERNIDLEMSGMDVVLRTLPARKWTLMIAPVEHFVTCDHPVCLRWIEPGRFPPLAPPGHGMRETELIFPVSPELALRGTFEGEDQVLEVGRDVIGMVNRKVAERASRQVYSAHSRFLFQTETGVISTPGLRSERKQEEGSSSSGPGSE